MTHAACRSKDSINVVSAPCNTSDDLHFSDVFLSFAGSFSFSFLMLLTLFRRVMLEIRLLYRCFFFLCYSYY